MLEERHMQTEPAAKVRVLRSNSRVITGFHRLGIVLAVPVLLVAAGTAVSAWFSNDGPYVPDPKVAPTTQVVPRSLAANPREMTNEQLRLEGIVLASLSINASNRSSIYEIETGVIRTFTLYQYPSVRLKWNKGNPQDANWWKESPVVVTPSPRFASNQLPPLPEGFVWGEARDCAAKGQERGPWCNYLQSEIPALLPTGPIIDQPPGSGVDRSDVNILFQSIISFEKNRGAVISAKEQPVLVGNILVQEDESKRKSSYNEWIHLKRGFDWNRINLAGFIAFFSALLYSLARALGWVIDGFVSRKAG